MRAGALLPIQASPATLPAGRVLAAARALTWPSRLVDLETQACQMVGDFGRAPVVVLEGGAEQPSTLPSSRQPAVGL